MKLLSAIIPISSSFTNFAAMKSWIRDCSDNDMEVIIVRDSFTESLIKEFDNILSLELLNQSIMVLDGTFQSPGLARNYGLKNSTGEWIAFWDCDDVPVPRNVLFELKKAGMNADLIIGQFSINGYIRKSLDLFDIAFNPGNWRIVYKRKLIGKAKYRDYLWGEDQLFILETGVFSSEIYISDLHFYNYIVGSSFQLTANKSNSASLKGVLNYAVTNVRLKGLENKAQIASLMILIRMSMTFIQRAVSTEKKASIKYVCNLHLRLIYRYREKWMRAMYEILKRRALKK